MKKIYKPRLTIEKIRYKEELNDSMESRNTKMEFESMVLEKFLSAGTLPKVERKTTRSSSFGTTYHCEAGLSSILLCCTKNKYRIV